MNGTVYAMSLTEERRRGGTYFSGEGLSGNTGVEVGQSVVVQLEDSSSGIQSTDI